MGQSVLAVWSILTSSPIRDSLFILSTLSPTFLRYYQVLLCCVLYEYLEIRKRPYCLYHFFWHKQYMCSFSEHPKGHAYIREWVSEWVHACVRAWVSERASEPPPPTPCTKWKRIWTNDCIYLTLYLQHIAEDRLCIIRYLFASQQMYSCPQADVTRMPTSGLLTASSHCGDSSHFSNIDM